MKKISLVLIGLLVLAAFASAHIGVITTKTGTQEYFGVAKTIQPAGISWVIGVNYKNGDYLTFTLPTGWTFGTPASGAYYLVTRSNTTGNYGADANANGLTEWSFFNGGPLQNSVTFRVTDVVNQLFNNATSWFLSTMGSFAIVGAGSGGTIPMIVPAGPDFTVAGKPYNITVDAIDGINNSVRFDGTPATGLIFTCYPEFTATLTAITETIDVLYGRMKFTGNKLIAGSAAGITVTQTARNYSTTLAANDLFRNTVIGDMTGVSYAQFYATTKTPATMTQAVVDVPGTTITAQSGVASPAYIVVNGTTTLLNRSFTDTLAFVPTGTWFGRTLLNAVPFQTWITNGTVFRSVFFATAIARGDYSAFRLANHSAVAADIWVEVWLDDGQKTTAAVKLPTSIPAMGKFSINGWDLAVQAGLLPDANMTDGSWRGRVIFTIWAPSDTTFGTEVYQVGGLGYTEITLEKVK
jgi:hypothetical protein